MARLKTAPRVILGLLVVGAIGYGVNYWIDNRPKTVPQPVDVVQPAPVEQPQVVQQAPQPQYQQPQVVQQAPAPVAEPPIAARGTTHDAGMNALLKGGSK